MALIEGDTCGFVLSAPSGDPGASSQIAIDDDCWATKFTSPVSSSIVSEIGWYCKTASQESNFEVAIYTDEGNNKPTTILDGYSQTNAKGITTGWKISSGLNISLSASTVYWIVVQLDNVSTTTYIAREDSGFDGRRSASTNTQTTLPIPASDVPWNVNVDTNGTLAIYALYEAATGTNTQVNIGDTFKEIAAYQVNIGDTWKEVAGIQVNIGDTWKEVF